jgi:hypothetical protein
MNAVGLTTNGIVMQPFYVPGVSFEGGKKVKKYNLNAPLAERKHSVCSFKFAQERELMQQDSGYPCLR